MNWQDIWLKEGLASYAEWLWLARDGGFDAVSAIIRRESGIVTSASLIGRPPSDGLYNDSVYLGGARLFHALRTRLGDEVFFNILQTYAERFQYANAGTGDFIDIAEEVSGEDLGEFFDRWLYSTDWQDID
jgi:aminopeptidase N